MCSSQTATLPPAGPGRPKDMAKRAAILDAARQMFTQGDFDRVSMDQIAAAGVSCAKAVAMKAHTTRFALFPA